MVYSSFYFMAEPAVGGLSIDTDEDAGVLEWVEEKFGQQRLDSDQVKALEELLVVLRAKESSSLGAAAAASGEKPPNGDEDPESICLNAIDALVEAEYTHEFGAKSAVQEMQEQIRTLGDLWKKVVALATQKVERKDVERAVDIAKRVSAVASAVAASCMTVGTVVPVLMPIAAAISVAATAISAVAELARERPDVAVRVFRVVKVTFVFIARKVKEMAGAVSAKARAGTSALRDIPADAPGKKAVEQSKQRVAEQEQMYRQEQQKVRQTSSTASPSTDALASASTSTSTSASPSPSLSRGPGR